ncbi:MAG TPA: hypothetical protein VNW50_13550 [Streptosporangiaceae bacterium]|nr:hypothetical protein [Streptosporangiaceae bacterium]
MTRITDDHAIREALAELTDGQPPMPPGRFAAVRKRAIRHRRRQVAAVISSVLAVAGLVTGLSRLPTSTGPLARPSWALQWPDLRNGSVPQSVLDDAVAGWVYTTGYETGSPNWSAAAVTHVVRLFHPVWYVGQTIDHGQEIAVIFEVSGPMGPRLVAGYTSASEVMPGHAAWDASTIPWVMNSRPAPRPGGQGLVPEVSEYVQAQSASGLSGDNWIVVLTSPAVQRISWYGPTVASGSGAHSSSDELVVANLGQLRGDVMLRIPGNPGESIPVGIPGAPDIPALAAPPALTAPSSFNEIVSFTGQGNETDVDSSLAPSRQPAAFIADCYNAASNDGFAAPSPGGTGPLRISVNGHALPAVECTSGQQMLMVPHSYQSHKLVIQITSSDLTAWQVAFGSVG